MSPLWGWAKSPTTWRSNPLLFRDDRAWYDKENNNNASTQKHAEPKQCVGEVIHFTVYLMLGNGTARILKQAESHVSFQQVSYSHLLLRRSVWRGLNYFWKLYPPAFATHTHTHTVEWEWEWCSAEQMHKNALTNYTFGKRLVNFQFLSKNIDSKHTWQGTGLTLRIIHDSWELYILWIYFWEYQILVLTTSYTVFIRGTIQAVENVIQ
jgi:hypothetical protein